MAGRVIWLTPKGAQGKRMAGIGVQFSEQDGGSTQKKIDNYLAGALGGDEPTHTVSVFGAKCQACRSLVLRPPRKTRVSKPRSLSMNAAS